MIPQHITAAEPGQEEATARALVRAHRAGLQIIGRGFTRGGHHRCFAVTSATVPDLSHIVTVRDLHITCSCTAGQFNRICAHAALVRSTLVAERFASSDHRLERQEQALHTATATLEKTYASKFSIFK